MMRGGGLLDFSHNLAYFCLDYLLQNEAIGFDNSILSPLLFSQLSATIRVSCTHFLMPVQSILVLVLTTTLVTIQAYLPTWFACVVVLQALRGVGFETTIIARVLWGMVVGHVHLQHFTIVCCVRAFLTKKERKIWSFQFV